LNNIKIISFNIAAGNKNGRVKLYYEKGGCEHLRLNVN